MAEYFTDLGIKDYKIIQDTDSYAFSQDSVLLANLAKLGSKDYVLDLGCGSGILATLAIIKKGVNKAVGLELQKELCDMARRSAELNDIDLEIINGDVKEIGKYVKPESFDKVICNPPYFANTSPIANGASGIARSEGEASLDDFVSAASYALRYHGDLWIVYKIARLAELFVSLAKHRLAPKEMIIVYPKLSRGADTVIVCAKKGGKDGLKTSTFIAQNEDNTFTEQYLTLYK